MSTRIIHADVMDGLRQLPDESVHCVVTSPPYWRLRDYGYEGQIGLEPTVAGHVAKMVEVFAEVRRVLRPDGVLFLNYGDMWAGSWGSAGRQGAGGLMADRSIKSARQIASAARKGERAGAIADGDGLKPKDLVMMPERIALAMQDAGWWVRDRIIWRKPNPMPSSVEDRCTPCYEIVWQMTKSARYFWDQDAISEPASSPPTKMPDNWDTGAGGHGSFHRSGREKGRKNEAIAATGNAARVRQTEGFQDRWDAEHAAGAPLTRNRRNVWDIATEPYPEGHFATMPTRLAKICIQAATSAKGCCRHCGKPWQRVVDSVFVPQPDVSPEKGVRGAGSQKPMDASNGNDGYPRGLSKRTTTGWERACECQPDLPVPCTVLDPFGGAGTTGLVADRLGRHAVLIEASAIYVAQHIEPRLSKDRGGLLDLLEAAK